LILEIFKKVEKYGHPRKTITPEDIKRADYEAELQRFANPKPEAINDLFWNLGINDILSQISWKRTSSK
jgi:predicted subunit of tRNA(5-methylaminomethyl-2-thiouridylate) methyltransferase